MPQNHIRSNLRRPEIQKFPGRAFLACTLHGHVSLPPTVLSSQFPRQTSAKELPSPLVIHTNGWLAYVSANPVFWSVRLKRPWALTRASTLHVLYLWSGIARRSMKYLSPDHGQCVNKLRWVAHMQSRSFYLMTSIMWLGIPGFLLSVRGRQKLGSLVIRLAWAICWIVVAWEAIKLQVKANRTELEVHLHCT